eukprot:6204898-Pleurochrysis_carterae.AAC.1
MVRKLRLCPFQNRAIGINNKQVIRQLTQRKIRNITSAREVGRSVNLHMKVFTRNSRPNLKHLQATLERAHQNRSLCTFGLHPCTPSPSSLT